MRRNKKHRTRQTLIPIIKGGIILRKNNQEKKQKKKIKTNTGKREEH